MLTEKIMTITIEEKIENCSQELISYLTENIGEFYSIASILMILNKNDLSWISISNLTKFLLKNWILLVEDEKYKIKEKLDENEIIKLLS